MIWIICIEIRNINPSLELHDYIVYTLRWCKLIKVLDFQHLPEKWYPSFFFQFYVLNFKTWKRVTEYDIKKISYTFFLRIFSLNKKTMLLKELMKTNTSSSGRCIHPIIVFLMKSIYVQIRHHVLKFTYFRPPSSQNQTPLSFLLSSRRCNLYSEPVLKWAKRPVWKWTKLYAKVGFQ